MSLDQPLLIDLRDLDVAAWLPILRATTADGTELVLDVLQWESMPSVVEVRVVDPPVDEEVLFSPSHDGNVFYRAFYDAALPADIDAPSWGRSGVRFARESDSCSGDRVVMKVRPHIDDVLYEVVGSNGESFLGPLPVVDGLGGSPSDSYSVTLVDAYGNRGETLVVDYDAPGPLGCSTAAMPETSLLRRFGRRR